MSFIRDMLLAEGDKISKTKAGIWVGAILSVANQVGIIGEDIYKPLLTLAIALFGVGVRDRFKK